MIRGAWCFTRLAVSHTKFLKQVRSILCLMHKQTSRSIINLKTKEIMKQSKTLEIKIISQKLDNIRDKGRTIACDDNVIYIKQWIHNERMMSQDEQITISSRSVKPNMKQLRSKPLKPSSRSLFETIKSFMKKADMSWKSRINMTLRLSHIDLFLKNTMEKGIIDIQLP